MEANNVINELINYGIVCNLVEEIDAIYLGNRIIDILKVDSFERTPINEKVRSINNILTDLEELAISNEVISDRLLERDHFDTVIMNLLTPLPREVNHFFKEYYNLAPNLATDYLYKLSIDTNYVRKNRNELDLEWKSPSIYGDLVLSINLSKPEIDPSEIDYFKQFEKGKTRYPKCMLCRENVGYSGSIISNQNTNMRTIDLKLDGDDFYLVYSPYSYYNEHCHIASSKHIPMEINEKTFVRFLDFLDKFPHYFIGSNADLPIVGSSVLVHEHYKGGKYDFPIYHAIPLFTKYIDGVKFELLNWPLTTFKLTSPDKNNILSLANKVYKKWLNYTNKSINIIGFGNVNHNTITPIARKVNNEYEIYLALRNNRVDEKHPYGIFHPDETLHHIKKENIGVIEVMGFAVLPGRLKKELEILRKVLNKVYDEDKLNEIPLHIKWYNGLKGRSYRESDLQYEVGKKFVKILESCNVFKYASIEDVLDFMESIV